MNKLSLYWIETDVDLFAAGNVESLGFCVDEQPLPEWLRWIVNDPIGEHPLARAVSRLAPSQSRECLRATYEELMLVRHPASPDGRTQLYGCPCGDAQCGGLFVACSRTGSRVQWSNFGNISNTYAGMPTLNFEWSEYKAALAVARGLFT